MSAEERLTRALARLVPRLARQTWAQRAPLEIARWDAPGEPVPFELARAATYSPAAPGEVWGRAWGTTWFRLDIRVPEEWAGQDVRAHVDLGFTDAIAGFQAEGLVLDDEGCAIGGLEPLRRTVAVPSGARALWVEAAANPDIAQEFTFVRTDAGGRPGDLEPNDPDRRDPVSTYTLGEVFLTVRDDELWHLQRDLEVLSGLRSELAETEHRRAAVSAALRAAVDSIEASDTGAGPSVEAIRHARETLAPALAARTGSTSHIIHAVGHAHIDSAWLWPIRETRRKVARTFANAIALMDRYPDFVFVASSAQQYAWIKEDHPDLFERIRERVAEGRFVPVGGQWIEPDCILPGGESLARQFVEGRRFFDEEFGAAPTEVWVPDSFGYSAALPQIAALAGARNFLTQKLSWNDTNSFPHHSLLWEGIDGTRLFTHFPPADTYNSRVSADELFRAQRQFAPAHARTSLLPYGWGDGGGGPTEEMVEAAHRFGDLEGAPRVRLTTPETFFAEAREELSAPPVWVGELYLEAHRGVSTTQQPIKRGNRRNESLLRRTESAWTAAAVRTGADYPHDELRAAWQEVLLLQFHDILPGSSIEWVHTEARERHERITETLERLLEEARVLVGLTEPEVPAVDATVAHVDVESGSGTLRSDHLLVRFEDGYLVSLTDLDADRELVPAGTALARPLLYRDRPVKWDAWDLDEDYERSPLPVGEPELRADADAVIARYAFGASSIEITHRLSADAGALEVEIDLEWHEDEAVLKLDVPLSLRAGEIETEVQFGHVRRPLHRNTSWERAAFEFAVQRWVRVAEGDYGVSIANLHTPGMSAWNDVSDGESRVLARPTLARAPRYPDPTSDVGRHRHLFRVRPGASTMDAIADGYALAGGEEGGDRFGTGIAGGRAEPSADALVWFEGDPVAIESIHLAPDASGDVLVRCYEPLGRRARGQLRHALGEGTTAMAVDLHGEAFGADPAPARVARIDPDGRVELRPFEIATVRFRRS